MKKTSLRAAPALVGVIASVVVLAAGPALGARISKCATISKPGSYTLTRNLTAVGDCLVVAADFVTLDLGGWVITGDGSTGGGVTDQGNSRRGIAVRNGTVTGFSFGVGLGETSGAVVEKVRAIDNSDVCISVGPGSTVSGNTARDGIFCISVGPGSTFSGNTVRGGGEFTLVVGPGSIVSGNTVEGGGVSIASAGGITISGNTVVSFGARGISAGPGSTVSGNTVQNAPEGGISAGPGSTISGNTVRGDSGGVGINVRCPSNVIGNTATDSEQNLVLIGDGCTNIDNLAP
jgi:hypothetical protein